jgi:H+-transporting ATPase
MGEPQPIDKAHKGASEAPVPASDAGASLDTDLARGLTSEEAERRLAEFGPNGLEEKKVTLLERLTRYFWGPIPWMIEAAAVLSAILKDWNDFAIITLMLLINAGISYWQEAKAEDAIKVLKKQLAPIARALRDGVWASLPARNLVPGDVVALKIGDVVPADLKLVSGDYLSTDESALTGESLPVDKKQGDAAYSGSIVKLGAMDGIVTATGTKTYFGRTAQLVQSAETRSHFQRAVLRIGNFLIMSTIALVVLILIVSLYREEPFLRTLKFCLILTVAAIPVALPAVLSVTMAIGAERIARMKAVVSRLVAIEELAGIDVLCADKTGTLTKNQLTLGDALPVPGTTALDLLQAAALACDHDDPDAIDNAVITGWEKDGGKALPQLSKFTPFDPVSKRTEAIVTRDGKTVRYSKGAPQVIFDLCKLKDTVRTGY